MTEMPKVVLLGGGTGSYELLLGLKEWTPHITAVINMCDDGGSTGRLRVEQGVMPPGDIRQCLVALSNNPEIANLFSYRFDAGELAGHPVGNLILAALEREKHNFKAAIEVASDMLNITGKVVPVTLTNHQLVMQDGEVNIRGQEAVRLHVCQNRERKLWLEPEATITAEAQQAIAEADLVVIAPGGLYWTLLPLFAVKGVPEALQTTPGQVVCVADLMNRPEQHQGWHVVEYVREMEKYLGTGSIDTVLYNTQTIGEDLRKHYAAEGELPVDSSKDRFAELAARSVGAELLAEAPYQQSPADVAVRRTLIRHDGQKVTEQLRGLL